MSINKIRDCAAKKHVPPEMIQRFLNEDYDPLTFNESMKTAQFEIIHKKRNAKLAALAKMRGKEFIDDYVAKGGSYEEALVAYQQRGALLITQMHQSMDSLEKGIFGNAYRKLPEFIKTFKPTRLGWKYPKEHAEDMVLEILGTNTNNPVAKKLANEMVPVLEGLRRQNNNVGGKVGKISDGYVPTVYDNSKIIPNKARFIEVMKQTVDYRKSNLRPDETFEGLYKEILEFDDLDNLVSHRGGPVSRMSKSRTIHFKDGESWLKFNKEFGTEDIPKLFQDYIATYSRANANMQIGGPNPQTTWDELKAYANAKHNNVKKMDAASKGKTASTDNISILGQRVWDIRNGNMSVGSRTGAKIGASLRMFFMAKAAPGIILSQLGDIPNQAWISHQSGFGQAASIMKPVHGIIKMVSVMPREEGIKWGYIADTMLGQYSRVDKMVDENNLVHPYLRKYSDTSFRMSGVSRATEAMQLTSVLDNAFQLGKLSDKTFAQLDPKLKRTLGRYGASEEFWDAIRVAKNTEGMIDPDLITDQNVVEQLIGMLNEEARIEVLEPSARELSWFRGSPAGTLKGELMRFFGMFKSFALSALNTHTLRSLRQGATIGDRLEFMMFAFVVGPMFGYMIDAAKTISNGEIPADPLKDLDAFKRAVGTGFARNNGFGAFADFLYSMEDRRGLSFEEKMSGPVVSGVKTAGARTIDVGKSIIFQDMDAFRRVTADTAKSGIRAIPPLQLPFLKTLSEVYVEAPLVNTIDPTYNKRMMKRKKSSIKSGRIQGLWANPYKQ